MKVYLLTSKKSVYAMHKDFPQGNILDVNDYIKINLAKNPELENFVGFSEEDNGVGQDTEMADESVEGLFEPHMELSQILLGVK